MVNDFKIFYFCTLLGKRKFYKIKAFCKILVLQKAHVLQNPDF